MTIQNIVTSVLENVKEQTDKKQNVLPDGVKGQILVKKSADETEWKDPGEVPDVYTQAEQRMLGAYNLLPNDLQSHTENGMTFTKNSDGTFVVSGTNTYLENVVAVRIGSFIAKKGMTYTISDDNNTNNDSTTQRLWVSSTLAFPSGHRLSTGIPDIYQNHTQIALADEECLVYLQIFPGADYPVSQTFKPMIHLSAYEADYVPYAMSNYDLTYRQPEMITGYTVDSNYMLNVDQIRFNVTRIGNIVIININCEFAATTTGWLTFVTGLPRPINYVYAVLFSATGKSFKIQVTNEGYFAKGSDYSTEGLWYSGQIVYFTID